MALRRAGRAIRAEGRMGRSHLLLVDDPGSAAENVDGTRRLKGCGRPGKQQGPAAAPTRTVDGNGSQRGARVSTAVGRMSAAPRPNARCRNSRRGSPRSRGCKKTPSTTRKRRADSSTPTARQAYRLAATPAIILARRREEAVKRELKTCHVDELLTRKDTDLPCSVHLVSG